MPQDEISLSGLYPDLSPDQLDKVQQFYSEYVELICGIYERQQAEAKEQATAESNNLENLNP